MRELHSPEEAQHAQSRLLSNDGAGCQREQAALDLGGQVLGELTTALQHPGGGGLFREHGRQAAEAASAHKAPTRFAAAVSARHWRPSFLLLTSWRMLLMKSRVNSELSENSRAAAR